MATLDQLVYLGEGVHLEFEFFVDREGIVHLLSALILPLFSPLERVNSNLPDDLHAVLRQRDQLLVVRGVLSSHLVEIFHLEVEELAVLGGLHGIHSLDEPFIVVPLLNVDFIQTHAHEDVVNAKVLADLNVEEGYTFEAGQHKAGKTLKQEEELNVIFILVVNVFTS